MDEEKVRMNACRKEMAASIEKHNLSLREMMAVWNSIILSAMAGQQLRIDMGIPSPN